MPSSAQLKLGASYALVWIEAWDYKDSRSLENKISQIGELLDKVEVRLIKLSWATKAVNYEQKLQSKGVNELGDENLKHKLRNKTNYVKKRHHQKLWTKIFNIVSKKYELKLWTKVVSMTFNQICETAANKSQSKSCEQKLWTKLWYIRYLIKLWTKVVK